MRVDTVFELAEGFTTPKLAFAGKSGQSVQPGMLRLSVTCADIEMRDVSEGENDCDPAVFSPACER